MPLDYFKQALTYLYFVIGGVISAFLYDILRISRRTVKTPGFLVSIQDILYWLVISIASLLFIYQINDGEIRGFIIVGMLTGASLYIILFSRTILFITVPVFKIIAKFIGKILKLLLMPFVFVKKIIIKIKLKKLSSLKIAKDR